MKVHAAAIGLLLLMVPAAASAQSPAYVGTWGGDAEQCATDQSRLGAPLILRRRGYDQHETHCTFTSVRERGRSTWQVEARCSVEGDKQALGMTLSVRGRQLTIRDELGHRMLRRCRRG